MINCNADGKFVYASITEDLSDGFRVDYLRGYVGFRENVGGQAAQPNRESGNG